MQAFQAERPSFDETETQVLGISIDSFAANRKFAEEAGIGFPLLSDLKREVSSLYGVLDETTGVAKRTTFVIDKEGIVRHVEQGPSAIDPAGALSACRDLAGG